MTTTSAPESVTDWLDLRDRVAVVTGAAGGIGAAIALELARNGMRLAVLDLNRDGAVETADRAADLGVASVGLGIDITDSASVGSAAELVTEKFGGADVLINNAGIMRAGDLATVALDDWQRVLDVNLTGYLLCSQAFGASMREQGRGSIVHISSISASHPQPSSGAYSPGKAAVSMLSRTLAFEWGPYGVRSNVLAPGMTRTPLTESFYTTRECSKPAVASSRYVASAPHKISPTPQCGWRATAPVTSAARRSRWTAGSPRR